MKEGNLFEKEMRVFSLEEKDAPMEAWKLSDKFQEAMESGGYQKLSKEKLKAFLQDAYSKQSKDGMIRILEDPEMPYDARCAIWYKPTYVVAVISIYTMVHYPEMMDESLIARFKNLLDAAFRSGIVAHGIYGPEYVASFLDQLAKADGKRFLEDHADFSSAFTTTIRDHLEELADIANANEVYEELGWNNLPINALAKKIVAFWDGYRHPVFVYGTLRKGEVSEGFLKSSVFCGYFQLKGYKLVNLGTYSGIKECEDESVLGEVYFVADDTLKSLDKYEAEGTLFKRKTVFVSGELGGLKAEAYVYAKESGDSASCGNIWHLKDKDYVWYAAYGSNMKAERFNCYIFGGRLEANKRIYEGCSDKSHWTEERLQIIKGRVYFANESPSWQGKGVAFFDPKGNDMIYMREYKITFDQLKDVWKQEGNTKKWYNALYCLGIAKDGCPIYTITASDEKPTNKPSEEYVKMFDDALKEAWALSSAERKRYLKGLGASDIA